jgi:hypothetical protein
MRGILTGLLLLLAAENAYAFKCDKDNAKRPPIWVSQYGLNTNPDFMYGYAQLIPKKKQSLQRINEQLKANALGDLSTSINSEVSRTVISQRDNLGNDQAFIQSSAESNISTGQLSSIDSFIDQKECIAYARVAIEKANIPFISAVSYLRLMRQKTVFNTIKLSEIEAANSLLAGLPDMAAQSGQTATTQLASLSPELTSIETEINSRKIDILALSLSIFSGSKRKELELAAEILDLIKKVEQSGQSPARHASVQKNASQKHQAILQVLASDKIAIGWIKTKTAIDGAILKAIDKNPDKYWAAPTSTDAEELKKTAAEFELKQTLYLELTTQKARKFGIDEVDITLSLSYAPVQSSIAPTTLNLAGRAIGRPISDDIIAEKVSSLLAKAL